MTLHVHTKTAPKANHPHFLPKYQTLKRFIIFKAQDFCSWSLFFVGKNMMCFCNGRPPFGKKILSGRVRTSSKPLVMRRRIPPSAAWRWKMCWAWVGCAPDLLDSGWGNFRNRTSPKKKVRFQEIYSGYFRKTSWWNIKNIPFGQMWCFFIILGGGVRTFFNF